ncbi:hypothetical protein OESDEN_07109 [Oesophagostomum dentatum]|uniref:Ras family protein n=1 Tax=Oesophagostomum dentatum TaxID=61180 RepID=A0A0B1TCA6_OESDE|nr:hypothetical protein OESDEN_07109 [Oesophagostomum dentatum]
MALFDSSSSIGMSYLNETEDNSAPTITTLKILIIGESGVGKSSLMLRFVDDTFDPELAATIGTLCLHSSFVFLLPCTQLE